MSTTKTTTDAAAATQAAPQNKVTAIVLNRHEIGKGQRPFLAFESVETMLDFMRSDGCAIWSDADAITPPRTVDKLSDLASDSTFDLDEATGERQGGDDADEIIRLVTAGESVTYWVDGDDEIHFGTDRDEVLKDFVEQVPTGDDSLTIFSGDEAVPLMVQWMLDSKINDWDEAYFLVDAETKAPLDRDLNPASTVEAVGIDTWSSMRAIEKEYEGVEIRELAVGYICDDEALLTRLP